MAFSGFGRAQDPEAGIPAHTSGGARRGGAAWQVVEDARANFLSSMQPLLGGKTGGGEVEEGPKRISAQERMERYIESAAVLSESRVPQLASVLRTLKPLFGLLLHAAIMLFMGYARIYSWFYKLYQGLPLLQLQMVAGLLLCFFGGTFVALIAAFEAFRTMGGEKLLEHWNYCVQQARVVQGASAKDDTVDEDKDGIADVDQITAEELTQRKLKVAMVAIAEPQQLQMAVGALWSACLAVLGTLKLQFAQTTAYAVALAEIFKFPIVRICAPALTWGLGKELTHWVDPIIDTTLKVICILLVWWIEKIRSALYSGVRGGQLFAQALITWADENGWMNKVPDFIAKKPFNADESYLDEAVGYTVAAIGFYWQVSHLFFLPFPIDWLLWPFSVAEHLLEVQISWV
mmetsp:Transcript_16872/g.36313  ORF Transcript_16872/g.36313 Transcript_16872/m.36313 type:complete len:404 (-) Transcript_16872:175-1386(-)